MNKEEARKEVTDDIDREVAENDFAMLTTAGRMHVIELHIAL